MKNKIRTIVLILCGVQFLFGFAMLYPRLNPRLRFSMSEKVNAKMKQKCLNSIPQKQEMRNITDFLDASLTFEHSLRCYIDAAAMILLGMPILVALLLIMREKEAKADGSCIAI